LSEAGWQNPQNVLLSITKERNAASGDGDSGFSRQYLCKWLGEEKGKIKLSFLMAHSKAKNSRGFHPQMDKIELTERAIRRTFSTSLAKATLFKQI
jgi:hypothetical protein